MRYFIYISGIGGVICFLILLFLLPSRDPMDLLSQFRMTQVTHSITDYGKIQHSVENFFTVSPDSLKGVAEIFRIANKHHVRVRIRGGAHSANASSLPRANEVLILTERLQRFRFDQEGTITVGAGVKVHELRMFLKSRGYNLLVYDGGGGGPTLGGFISGGGIGYKSRRYGGFWENVVEITFVAGSGRVMTLRSGDELFPWIFGSMGQLGFIVEAKLKILSYENEPYPMGEHGFVPRPLNADPISRLDRPHENSLYWFTLFVPTDRIDFARAELQQLMEVHPDALEYTPIYEWPNKFFTFNPKLVYPYEGDFVSIGIWGIQKDPKDSTTLMALERGFAQLAMDNRDKGYRRYAQTDFVAPGIDYRQHFGEELFEKFLSLKRRLDPNFILGCDTVFKCP